MKLFLLLLLFLSTLTFSQIPEFDMKDALSDEISTNGGMCFVDWDNDGLADIISANWAVELIFFKNVGTATSPQYEDHGFITKANGDTVCYGHG